jgi:hypothetical protein
VPVRTPKTYHTTGFTWAGQIEGPTTLPVTAAIEGLIARGGDLPAVTEPLNTAAERYDLESCPRQHVNGWTVTVACFARVAGRDYIQFDADADVRDGTLTPAENDFFTAVMQAADTAVAGLAGAAVLTVEARRRIVNVFVPVAVVDRDGPTVIQDLIGRVLPSGYPIVWPTAPSGYLPQPTDQGKLRIFAQGELADHAFGSLWDHSWEALRAVTTVEAPLGWDVVTVLDRIARESVIAEENNRIEYAGLTGDLLARTRPVVLLNTADVVDDLAPVVAKAVRAELALFGIDDTMLTGHGDAETVGRNLAELILDESPEVRAGRVAYLFDQQAVTCRDFGGLATLQQMLFDVCDERGVALPLPDMVDGDSSADRRLYGQMRVKVALQIHDLVTKACTGWAAAGGEVTDEDRQELFTAVRDLPDLVSADYAIQLVDRVVDEVIGRPAGQTVGVD